MFRQFKQYLQRRHPQSPLEPPLPPTQVTPDEGQGNRPSMPFGSAFANESEKITVAMAPEQVAPEHRHRDITPEGSRVNNTTLESVNSDQGRSQQVHSKQAQPIIDAEEALRLGDEAREQKDWPLACTFYRQVLDLVPQWGFVHQKLAESLTHQGQFEQAIPHYRHALELKLEAKQNQDFNGHSSSSIPAIAPSPTPSLESSPPSPQDHAPSSLEKILEAEALGRAVKEANEAYVAQQWQRTLDCCHATLERWPTHAPTHKLIGNALYQLGQEDDARAAYEEALKHQPDFAEVYVNLGNIEARKTCWDEAIAHYQQAIALNPDFAGAYRNLAKVWTQQGNERLATECLYHAIELEPDSVDHSGYFTLAGQLLQQGQTQQAIHCYRYLLEPENKSPRSDAEHHPSRSAAESRSDAIDVPMLHRSLADALAQDDQWQEAVTHYRQAHTLQTQLQFDLPVNPTSSDPEPGAEPEGIQPLSITLPQTVHPWSHNGGASKLVSLAITSTADGAIASPTVPATSQSSLSACHQHAQRLAQQEQWVDVIGCINQGLQAVEPDLAQLYELLAKALRLEDRTDEAIECYKKVAVLHPHEAKPLVNLGSLYAQEQQWKGAIVAYQQAIQRDPNFAGAYRNLARVWQTQENETAAADCWVKAYSLEPEWGTATEHFELGQTLKQQGKVEAAIASLQRAVSADNHFADAHFQLAELYQHQGQDEAAVNGYGKAIQADPHHQEAIYALGHLLVKHQQADRAIVCFQQFIQLAPESIPGYCSLRDALVSRGQLEEAIPCYQWLAKLQPDLSAAHHELGDILNRTEQWDKAIPAFRRAIQLAPDFSWSHNNLGDALLQMHEWEEAAQAFQAAIAFNPRFAWSHYNLGEALIQLGNWDGAIAAYHQAIEQDPDLPYVHQKLGDALKLRANADMENALEHYDQAIEQNPAHIDSYHKRLELKKDDPDLYVQLANALLRQGERTEAIVACQMGLHVQGSHLGLKAMLEDLTQQEHAASMAHSQNESATSAEGHVTQSHDELAKLEEDAHVHDWDYFFNLGNQFQAQGKLDAAILAYGKAIAKNPTHSWSHHQQGDAYLKQEQWADAVQAYAEAIALNSDYFWSHYNLGVAYTRQEQWHDAIHAYHRSIDENPGLNLPCLALRDTLLKQWDSLFSKGDVLLHEGDRDAARAFYRQAIRSYQERLYLHPVESTPPLPSPPSVLIIADDFLPQCFHYRVQQKLEHLEHAHIPAHYVSKNDIEAARNALHFCHVVIFYRVPALPDIIEMIRYAKALGKVVFYEIDDLIFDEIIYPAPFESYGGRISIDEYYGLIRGATLFREAMALCDYAIASTPALVTDMANIVAKRRAFLHRNALDSLNTEFIDLNLAKIERDYLSIFYGSGTKAHDTDFNQLAAPALARIFERYPDVRLTLVGYVSLPEVLEPYRDRIDRIDLIKEVEIYWELLQQADINIAVLKATRETHCKSEIKWLEAASLGIPSVVSATQTYREILTHGVDGFLAYTPEDWFDSLDRLIRDPDLRRIVADQAKAKAWAEYSVPHMATNIRQIIETAIASTNMSRTSRKLSGDPQANKHPSRNGNVSNSPSQKTKLLIVNVFYPPQSIGGATRIVKDNVKVLTEDYGDCYEISVFTTDDDYPVPYHLTSYTHNGVPVTKVSTPREEGMDWRYENPRIYEIFQEYLQFNRPDLIHFHCVQRLTGSALEAAHDLGIPYLVTVHDAWWISDHQFLVNDDGVECSYQQNDPLVTALDAKDVGRSLQRCRYLKRQLNHANAILAVSETFAEIYRQNGFPQTQANRNGIMPRPRLPRQPNPTGKVRCAHVGGMSAHKGYYLFKDAVISANLTNSEVIVVDHAQTVGSVSHGQWGSTPVTFIAKVSQDRMPGFYSTIDVLVAPSMWPESFGLVTREATAAGVWVIASDKGALAEDLEPGANAHVVQTEESTPLSSTLQTIDQHPDTYQTLLPDIFSVRTTSQQVQELTTIYGHIIDEAAVKKLSPKSNLIAS